MNIEILQLDSAESAFAGGITLSATGLLFKRICSLLSFGDKEILSLFDQKSVSSNKPFRLRLKCIRFLNTTLTLTGKTFGNTAECIGIFWILNASMHFFIWEKFTLSLNGAIPLFGYVFPAYIFRNTDCDTSASQIQNTTLRQNFRRRSLFFSVLLLLLIQVASMEIHGFFWSYVLASLMLILGEIVQKTNVTTP